MCDRTQEEILARELTYQRANVISETSGKLKHFDKIEYVEEHYKSLMVTARNILDMLSKHKRLSQEG